MVKKSGLITSNGDAEKLSDQYRTPTWLWRYCLNRFSPGRTQFALDAAASAEQSDRIGKYFCAREASSRSDYWGDGLTTPWYIAAHSMYRPTWCNPPYSRQRMWVEKAIQEHRCGSMIVMLLQMMNGDRYWTDLAYHANAIVFLAGRVAFIDPTTNAPAPENRYGSCLVYFDGTRSKASCSITIESTEAIKRGMFRLDPALAR